MAELHRKRRGEEHVHMGKYRVDRGQEITAATTTVQSSSEDLVVGMGWDRGGIEKKSSREIFQVPAMIQHLLFFTS